MPFKYKFRGFVRYGENKKSLLKIYYVLKKKFPYSRALRFSIILMNFFVKGKCMEAEEEYRFLIIASAKRKVLKNKVEIWSLPEYLTTINNDESLKWNHFYPIDESSPFESRCGCSPNSWSQSWKMWRKNCR